MRNGCAAVAALCSLAAGHPVLAPAWTPVPARAPAPDTSWVARSTIYEIFVRDFSPTGDFRGVIGGADRGHAVGGPIGGRDTGLPVGGGLREERDRTTDAQSRYHPGETRPRTGAGTCDVP